MARSAARHRKRNFVDRLVAGALGLAVVLVGGALGSLAASGAAVAATAQVPQEANPGNILNQQLLNRLNHPLGAAPGPGALPPVLSAPKPEAAPQKVGPGVHFVLKGVRIGKSHFLKPAELAAIYRPYIGQSVRFSDLQKIVEKIDALYRAKGVVTARAVLPPQRIANGIVRIDLVEGKIGTVEIKGNTVTRSVYIRKRIDAVPGQVVDAKKIENELIYFNRTNQTQLHASLKPGASFGLTNILLRATDPAAAQIEIFGDNEGVASTGADEGGIYIRDNKILGLGDDLEIYAVRSAGSTTGNAIYNIPVNRWGGTAGVSFARGQIKIVSGAAQPLEITGSSWTGAFNFVQPFFVTDQWKLAAALEFARDTSYSEIAGTSLGTTVVNKTSLGIRAQYIAPTTYSLFTLSMTPERAYGAGRLGSATVYNGTYSLVQRLPKPLARYSVALKSSWQYANRWAIAPAEQFSIGGANSVRGYAQGLLSGSSGYYLQLELHRSFPHHVDGFLFTDNGGVYNTSPRWQVITGIGAGFSWTWRHLTTSLAGGYAVDRTTPSQGSYQVNLRVALNFPVS